jgi:hypothetical protein
MISRRDALKTLIVSVGGGSLLSACGGSAAVGTITPGTARRFYSESEMALLSRVSDLLLPRTDTPGALDANVPALLDQLMAEWANSETQTSHRAALAVLDTQLQIHSGTDFLSASDAVAEQALIAVDSDAFAGERVEGYRGLKGLITQAYFATEAGAVQERQWIAVPGRWESCVDR